MKLWLFRDTPPLVIAAILSQALVVVAWVAFLALVIGLPIVLRVMLR